MPAAGTKVCPAPQLALRAWDTPRGDLGKPSTPAGSGQSWLLASLASAGGTQEHTSPLCSSPRKVTLTLEGSGEMDLPSQAQTYESKALVEYPVFSQQLSRWCFLGHFSLRYRNEDP